MSQGAWSGYISPPIFSKSSQFLKSTSSSKVQQIAMSEKENIQENLMHLKHPYPILYHHLQKTKYVSCSVQCSHKNKSSGFQCPAKNSCSKQHTATWETHTTQIISKSCFLRWKDYGLDGSILQVRPALSLRAEPCLHKQTEKLLNMVAKSLLAASVQEETWS